ncbi:MAG: hypothetical protein WC023_10680 [Rhodocyclaceae bacterium]|jgi:hypothetical protein
MAISAGSSSSVSGLVSQQLRLQQAERSANQAEASARALRRQAQVAQQSADRAQEGARSVKVQADQAQVNAGSAQQQLVSLKSINQLQSGFDTVRQQISLSLESLDVSASTAAPVINADGQATGTLLNVTA